MGKGQLHWDLGNAALSADYQDDGSVALSIADSTRGLTLVVPADHTAELAAYIGDPPPAVDTSAPAPAPASPAPAPAANPPVAPEGGVGAPAAAQPGSVIDVLRSVIADEVGRLRTDAMTEIGHLRDEVRAFTGGGAPPAA
jgi:hypothetical protein